MLKNSRLYYFKNSSKLDKAKGVINFDQVNCQLTFKEEKPNRFYLHMKGISRVFKLRAPNADEFRMWSYNIMKTIERSKGRKHDLGIDEKQLSVKSWRVRTVLNDNSSV